MTSKSRFILAISLTLLAVGAFVVFAVSRFADATRSGAAGLSYIDPTNMKQSFLGLGPGDIIMVYPGGPAETAGLRRGDRIVAIEEIPIAEQARLREIDGKIRNGDSVRYRVSRDEQERNVAVRFRSPLENRATVIYIVVHAIVASAFVLIGLLVFTRKPDDRRVAVFHAMMTVGALSIAGSMLLAVDNASMRGITVNPAQALLPISVISVFVLAFLPLTLHLALVFPRDRRVIREHPKILRWVYVVPIGGALLWGVITSIGLVMPGLDKAAANRVDPWLSGAFAALAVTGLVLLLRLAFRSRDEGWREAILRRPVHSLLGLAGILAGLIRVVALMKLRVATILLVAFVLVLPFLAVATYPVMACIALYRSYREAGVEERRQVKWPLWGTLIALGTKIVFSIIVWGIITFVMVTGTDLGKWTAVTQTLQLIPVIVYLLIPLSFAFAILKYRLMNIDVIIRKTVAYAILSGAIVVVYLVLVGGLGTLLIRSVGVQNQTMVITSTLVVALLFVPLRNKLQTLVDRNLFPHRFDYPATLRSITTDARTATDSGAFLRSACEKLQQALQNKAVVLFLERQDEYVAVAKVGVSDTIPGTLRIPHSFSDELDRPFDPRRRSRDREAAAALARIDSVLVVPLEKRAFISLAAKLSGGAFDVEDIDFLSSAADEILIGMDRIRREIEEEDFVQARAMQQTLLPRRMPDIADLEVSGEWQPARNMGGDYYDLIELGSHELAVCIGDVAGKGMSAALLMSGLQAAVRSSASSSPRELCERVRRVVVSSLSGGRFVTFCYATINTKTMTIRWCNAGHNPPILVRKDGTTLRLEGGGTGVLPALPGRRVHRTRRATHRRRPDRHVHRRSLGSG